MHSAYTPLNLSNQFEKFKSTKNNPDIIFSLAKAISPKLVKDIQNLFHMNDPLNEGKQFSTEHNQLFLLKPAHKDLIKAQSQRNEIRSLKFDDYSLTVAKCL